MSTSSFSHHSPPPATSAEPATTHRRIKLTLKPPKPKTAALTTHLDASENDSRVSAHAPGHHKTTITIKPLKIKSSRSSSVAETPPVAAQDEERKHLPKLIIKPPKPTHAIDPVPAPAEDEDTMEVDVSTPQIDLQPPLQPVPPNDEPPREEPTVEILSPPPASAPGLPFKPTPPPKPKVPRPIKLKPLKEVLRRLITQIKRKDDYAFFLSPVDTSQVPGYIDVIKHPMDFGTMTERIEKGQYRSLEQFKDDFLLVTANAKAFNPPPSLYHSEASKIETWGLDQIIKAAAHVIEYETDWNIDVVADEGQAPATSADHLTDQAASESAAASGEMPIKTRSPSVLSSGVGTPSAPAERSKKSSRGKKAPIVTESWEEGGYLPGTKDGLGAFPSCSDFATLMLELKLRGKRFTKKERLRREKEGPPYASDGSLDYSEMENPFSVLQPLAPKPLSIPELVPLMATGTTPGEAPTTDREASQLPEEKQDGRIEGPVALPPETLPEILSDLNRHVFVNPPSSTSTVGRAKLRHWTITRNPPRPTRAREEDEDAMLLGSQAKRRRVEHTDYGAFATLLGKIAAENGLKVDDFEEVFGGDERILDQIRQSIENRESTAKSASIAESDFEERERLLDADEYIRDVVYGGADGLAYFRSLAEFVGEYHGPLKQEPDMSINSGELGMPLAQWVETHIVNPFTLGNHATLRTAAAVLTRANIKDESAANVHATHPIARYLALANEDKSAKLEQLRELEALAEPSALIDIAPLLRKPEELFLAENEWTGREREQGQVQATATSLAADPIRASPISLTEAGTGAMLGLGLASALPGQSQFAGSLAGNTAGVIEHALNVGAEALHDLGRRISENENKDETDQDDSAGRKTEAGFEDPLRRRTRLTLIALAKRAPIDRIARLPPELVPVHIRHIVPTLGS